MEAYDYESEHRKKRRRREVTPRPIAARLTFDESVKGDVAVVSASIWHSLVKARQCTDSSQEQADSTAFVAITTATPLHSAVEDSVWTILQARPQSTDGVDDVSEPQSFIKLSPKSAASPSFLKAFSAVDHNRHGTHIPKTIDVRILPADPLTLEKLYVTIEKGLLEKVDDIQSKFGGGFNHYGRNFKADRRTSGPNGSAHSAPAKAEDRMMTLVREALSQLVIIHSGDVFPLPLPAHPITHVQASPAIAIDCEPVSQGLVSAKTKIILVQAGSSQENAIKKLLPAQPIIEESLEDTAEDTSNDQFFSAAEDRDVTTASEMDGASDDDSDSDGPEQDDSDEDSDSMDDLISLSAPGLPPQQAGTLSAMTAATPRPGGKRATGTHTPGSVYSSFSTATARAGSRPGKVFRTEPLLRKVPIDLLHPKPQADEDEESFVFVDTSTLAKIGCFSGDWVRIELAKNVSSRGFPPIGISALNSFNGEDESDWRSVRIFGLSGLSDQKPRYAVDKTGDRRSSFSQRDSFLPLTPAIYLSPVLLANLSHAQFVKVGTLPKAPRHDIRSIPTQRSSASKTPPLAKEVRLLKISTPMTTSREMQTALFTGLKHYFENRKRVLKKGDLIAIPVDQEFGKVVSASEAGESSLADEELSGKFQTPSGRHRQQFGTAWFYVQYIDAERLPDLGDEYDYNPWGGVATVDSLNTRISREGDSNQSISDAIETWTKYWLGVATVPQQNVYRSDIVTTNASLPQLEKLPLEKRLSDLIAASTSPRAVSLGMPPLVILLHSTQRQVGKTYTALSACSAVGVHTFPISCHALLSENASTTGGGDVKTEATLRARAERALSSGARQTAILIQHIDILTADRIVPALQEIISSSRVLVATTSKIDDVPVGIRSLFTHELEVTAPNETARETILRNACHSTSLPLSAAINLKNIALQTAALVAGDLLDVVNRASIARSQRLISLAEEQSRKISDIIVSGGQSTTHLLPSDFTSAISAARSTFSDAIGAPKIPTVTWNDVGGLSSQKDAIMETISLPLTHPELFANGVRKRSGILFYGPPGTGKTLLAKAIATEFSLNFFSVKGPELLNMYIGESEANVRRVFQRARDARPCVVFFDELDSVAPKRGNQGDSGGVMDRIVSQLLAELDGMSSSGGSAEDKDGSNQSSNAPGGVFVIGATNRPDLLDPALLRPGRFDKMLYLGVADTHEQQVTILKALTRKFTLSPEVNLQRVASRLPFTYTGADLYALCSDAMLKAITRKTKAVDEKVRQLSKARGESISTGYFFDHLSTEEDVQVVVNEDDFSVAQQELVGSVSRKELEHFERIRALFEDQDISAGTTAAGKKKDLPATGKEGTGIGGENGLPTRLAKGSDSRNNSAIAKPPHHHPQHHSAPNKPPAMQKASPTVPTATTLRDKAKGKSRDYQLPKMKQVIANPDSAPESDSVSDEEEKLDDSEADAAGESDFGISSRHLNGSLMNGVGINTSTSTSNNENGKEKSKIRPVAVDSFVHGDEDDDEQLYD